MSGVWAIVVAAGSGRRFGGPKQFALLEGRPVLEHAVVAARSVASGVVLVVPPAMVHAEDLPSSEAVVAGGRTRSESVRCGLAAVPDDAEVIVVHDGARPLAAREVFERVVAEVRAGADAATPVVAVTDTLRDLDGAPVDRDRLRAVQTPQAFAAAALRGAHAGGDEATDDVALVERAGGRVVTVEGDRWNLKVTEPDDLVVAAAILRGRERS